MRSTAPCRLPRSRVSARRRTPRSQRRRAGDRQHDWPSDPAHPAYRLHTAPGVLPMALPGKPNTAYTRNLLDDARDKIRRLKWDLSEVGLRDFLVDEERLGVNCTKYRAANANGWSFPPLAEARAAWCQRYGPTKWDNPVEEWSKPKAAKRVETPSPRLPVLNPVAQPEVVAFKRRF
jgi:hypothetical protein